MSMVYNGREWEEAYLYQGEADQGPRSVVKLLDVQCKRLTDGEDGEDADQEDVDGEAPYPEQQGPETSYDG